MPDHPEFDEREQLLDLLLSEAGLEAPNRAGAIARSGRSHPRLSYAQQRLWFLNRLEPWDTSYNIPASFLIRGPVQAVLLERAINHLIARHEVLRTNFRLLDGEPYQFIRDELRIPLPVIEPADTAAADQDALIEEWVLEEIRRARDLAQDPLINAYLLKLAPDRFVLIFNIHHIIADGWSLSILFGELSEIYGALEQGMEPHLPEPTLQYRDFSAWQRERLSGDYYQGLLDYWRGQLLDAPALLDLPADRRRPARSRHAGNTLYFDFGSLGKKQLKNLCDRHDATEYMVLLAVFAVLLQRYSGQADLVIGSPIANRNHKDLEQLVGFLANTLAIRLHLSGSSDFTELLQQVKERTAGAYDHQDMPFEKLVDELGVERRLEHSPLFQVMFIWQNATETHGLRMGRHPVEVLRPRNVFSKFDLTLAMEYAGERLQGWIEYSTELFLESTMQRLLQALRQALESVLADGRRRIGRIDLMTASEREYLLRHWNDAAAAAAAAPGIMERFEAQVDREPNAPAVRTPQGEWTYRELDRQANRIAHSLRARGLGTEDRVALSLERCYAMIATVLGVLKAGCTYVPVDPAYPQERIQHMLDGSGARLLIASDAIAGSGPAQGPEVIGLDALLSESEGQPEHRPAIAVDKDNLVYLIYTSGSTGRPKGIGMPYRALDRLIGWFADDTPQRTRVLQFASLSFDVSFEETFGALCAGSCLCVADQALRGDIYALADYVELEGIERLILPVVVLHRWVEKYRNDGARFARVREIITTGEALMINSELCGFFQTRPHCRLINHYGPAETHVVTAHHFSGPPSAWLERNVPIGKPITNATLYVLDEQMQPLPLGAKGEIYIGGEAVARGYFGQPALTAERFVPDPFNRRPGQRLYRTGDLARYRDSGELEYIGRNDDMLKIRGHRVEPGEVQRALLELDGVAGAYVLVAQDQTSGRHMLGYLTAAQGREISETEALRRLKAVLPEFMLPRRLLVLDELPLTVNGKVDKSRLPPPPAEHPGKDTHAPPESTLEEVIAGIWGQHLGLDRISRHDNFFEIGGHSLQAANVMNDLRDLFELEMPVAFLFEHQSVREMAQAMLDSGTDAEEVMAQAQLIMQVASGSEQNLATLQQEAQG